MCLKTFFLHPQCVSQNFYTVDYMYFYTKYSILDICENCIKPGTNTLYILRQVKVILYVETTQQPVESVAFCIYCVIKF